MTFVIIVPGLLNGTLAVPGTLEIPGSDFPAGVANWATGVQRPVLTIDLVPVNQEWALSTTATAAKSDTEVLGVFVNSLENSADGHVIVNDAAAVPSAVCEEEFGIGIYHLSLAPKKGEIMTIDCQQVRWRKQDIHDSLLHRLTNNLGIRGIDVSVIVQIKPG